LVRETGRGNRVAVLSRDKTDVSRGGGINDRGKRMGQWYFERITAKNNIRRRCGVFCDTGAVCECRDWLTYLLFTY